MSALRVCVLQLGMSRGHVASSLLPRATLVTLAKQRPEDGFVKTEPFPYWKKRYTKIHMNIPLLDPTEMRMNKNSKVIVVEGNLASGVSDVAARIAKDFGLKHLPAPRLDDLYVNDKGFDYRTLNKYLDPMVQALDLKSFYENPHHAGVPIFKLQYYRIKYAQYIDALAYLFNSGQGVVLERSIHSDFVFTDAMFHRGFFPKDAYDFYYRLRYATIHELLRPHMVVYLDVDVNEAMARIKKKGIPYQVNSKVLTPEYLGAIEESYKKHYLEDANRFSELLVFKWNKPSEQTLEDMIFDIEKAQIDDWDICGDKFKDWNFYFNRILHSNRYKYTSMKFDLFEEFNLPTYDCPSLECSDEAAEHRDAIFESFVPNYRVSKSFDVSPTNILSFLKGLLSERESEDMQFRYPYY